jgi:outer membrane lipoprotein-sorting protein
VTLVLFLVLGRSVPAPVAADQTARPPIGWVDVAAAYEQVRDYSTLYEKEERAISNGERQTIRLFFRKPADVRLEWLDDKGDVEQTAVYRKGFNQDKLIARRKGLLGSIAGTLTLDPHSRLAMEDSRHPITEVGIGHITDVVIHDASTGAATSKFVAEEPLDGRPAFHFELDATTPASLGGVEGARRVDTWIDRALQLPVKVELRDASGTLLERHRFQDLRLNIGLTDQTFTL